MSTGVKYSAEKSPRMLRAAPRSGRHADEDVNAVQAGHHEVEREEHVRAGGSGSLPGCKCAMRVKNAARSSPSWNLCCVLEVLHHEEDAGAQRA